MQSFKISCMLVVFLWVSRFYISDLSCVGNDINFPKLSLIAHRSFGQHTVTHSIQALDKEEIQSFISWAMREG